MPIVAHATSTMSSTSTGAFERQLGHPDRRAGMRARVAEHLTEQFARHR